LYTAEPDLLVASRLRGSGTALRLPAEARRSAGFEELVLGPLGVLRGAG
jgi:hypothetical protein